MVKLKGDEARTVNPSFNSTRERTERALSAITTRMQEHSSTRVVHSERQVFYWNQLSYRKQGNLEG